MEMPTSTEHALRIAYALGWKHGSQRIASSASVLGPVAAKELAEAIAHTNKSDAQYLLDALENIEANLTGRDCFAERVADSLRRCRDALAIARATGQKEGD